MSAVEVIRAPESPKVEFCSTFEKAPLGLALCQRPGRVISLNPALEGMFVARSRTAQSLQLSDLVHPRDRTETERLLHELFAGSRDEFRIDSQIVGEDYRPVRWTVWRVVGSDGVDDSLLAMAEDLPGVAAAEQRLRQAERLESVGRLAGGVAHDFNNLLTGVLLYCDLLLSSLEPNHRARKYAEEIRNAGMQASGLVRQLLAIARPANSQPRVFSLNEIAEGMRNLLVRMTGDSVRLMFHLDPDLGLIKMDPAQAQQILLNLVLNARDAVSNGGQITVRTGNCKVQVLTDAGPVGSQVSLPCAHFVVEDNGIGMDDSVRAHLFEPFFTTKAGKGTGLGLANVHGIVTTNGGLIHIDSAPGQGTRVSVLLPLVSPAAGEAVKKIGPHSVSRVDNENAISRTK